MQKNQIGLFSHTIYKNKPKIEHQNVKLKTVKFMEENIGRILLSQNYNTFLSYRSCKGNKSKNKELRPYC